MTETWEWISLRDAVISDDAKRKPVRGLDRKPGPYPYWGASGVVDWVDDYLFDYPALLVSEDGENLKTRKTPISFIAKGRYWVNNHAHVLRARDEFDLRFLANAVENTDISSYLTGSTQPKLTAGNLGNIRLFVPPLDEQRSIAGVLGALDDLIEVNRGLAHQCDELAEALWHEATWGASSERRIADCATVVLGGTPSRKEPSYWGGDVAWLNSGQANEFRVLRPSEFITTAGLSKSSTKLMPKGATIIAITGATLGQVSRIEISACGNQSLVGVWAEESALNDFIYFGVRNRVDVLLRSATGGAQQHVNKANVEELTLPWITQSEIEAWHQVASPLMEATAELLFEAQTLTNTRDELLPLLMSGRVGVREDGVAA